MKYKLAVLFLIFLLILLFLWLQVRLEEQADACVGSAIVAPKIFSQAHRYHGISFSQKGRKGWFFVRDGKRCKLFTQQCLERISR